MDDAYSWYRAWDEARATRDVNSWATQKKDVRLNSEIEWGTQNEENANNVGNSIETMFLPNFWGTQNEESFLENFGEPKMKKILKTWGTQKGDQGNPKGKFP